MGNNQDEWEVEEIIDNMSSDKIPDIYKADSNDEEISSNGISKKRKKSKSEILQQRSEASLNISEFNLNEVGKERIKINELIKTSLKTTGHVVQKNLETVKKLKKLSVPLSKQQKIKIKRTITKEKICDEVSKWDSLIQSNRTAEQLVFPLKKPDFLMQSFNAVSENFVSKHPVEIAVSELLSKSENKLEPEKPLTEAEEKALKAMSAAEAKLRHDELMKHRALISYQEAKARYQNKIKSKRYHRLLKKEKLKKAMKEFEEIKSSDAEKALEKLAELDKLRILERMTLKHRNTGKWAKQQKIRAKYNPESRSVLKEDLNIGKQLREKVEAPEKVSLNRSVIGLNSNDLGLIEDTVEDDLDNNSDKSDSAEDTLLEAYKNALNENQEEKNSNPPEVTKSVVQNEKAPKKPRIVLDFTEQNLDSDIPENLTVGDEGIDDVMEDLMPTREAFGDEDCVAEFRAEKEAAANANKVDGIDLYLPGWGSWGGPGIQPSKSKKRKFFIKAPTAPPKKDTLGNVIINEDKDKKAAVHQVSSLPFPFTNVKQFESYIRQPVGHTWNPQSSFQNLVAPKVITKMGKIIEPMDMDDLVLNNNASNQRPIKLKRKKGTEDVRAF